MTSDAKSLTGASGNGVVDPYNHLRIIPFYTPLTVPILTRPLPLKRREGALRIHDGYLLDALTERVGNSWNLKPLRASDGNGCETRGFACCPGLAMLGKVKSFRTSTKQFSDTVIHTHCRATIILLVRVW